MAEGDSTGVYNNFKEQVMEGIFNLASGGDTLKIALVTGYTPDIDAHTVWTDVSTKECAGTGYSAGGATLTSQDVTQDDANDRGKFDAADVTWSSLTLTTPTSGTPGHAVLYDDTPTTPADPLVCSWVLGATTTNGGDYTISFSSDGVLYIG